MRHGHEDLHALRLQKAKKICDTKRGGQNSGKQKKSGSEEKGEEKGRGERDSGWLRLPEPQRVGPTWTEGSPGLWALRPQAHLVSGGATPDTATRGHTYFPCLTSSTGSTNRKRETQYPQPASCTAKVDRDMNLPLHPISRRGSARGGDRMNARSWGLSGQAGLF